MKRTGPVDSAFFMSAKIRPGKRVPSAGVKALTLTTSLALKYLTSRSSINCETSIDGEKPVRMSFMDSFLARIKPTVLEFHPGDLTS